MIYHRAAVTRIRVFVADDHPVFREGLVRAVGARAEMELAGEATDGRATLDAIRLDPPDVAVVDLRLPVLDGIAVARAVVREAIATRVVILSAYDDAELVWAALEAGAAGYLTKDARREEITDAVLAAARGETVLAPSLAGALAGEVRRRAGTPVLTTREREALGGLVRGLSAPAIARRARPLDGDRQDAPAAPVREARRLRSRSGCRRGDAARPDRVARTVHDDAERLIAWLRVAAIPVLLLGHGLISETSPNHRAFEFTVVAFSVYSVIVLIGASLRDVPPRVVNLLAALDIAFAGLLAFTTGGGFSQIRFAFVFVPVSAAFRRRPRLTLSVSVASVLVYVVQALSHPSRTNRAERCRSSSCRPATSPGSAPR